MPTPVPPRGTTPPCSTLTRRAALERSLLAAGGLALAPLAARMGDPSQAAAASVGPQTLGPRTETADWSSADYWRLADRVAGRFDGRWVADVGAYTPVRDPYSTVVNAAMLTIHATAAARGHQGAARNDARARALVAALTDSPAPWRESGSRRLADKMFHTPGWTGSLAAPLASQDKAIDPKVAEGLAVAHGARSVLGLDEATADRIVDHVDRCARGRFFRYPNVRLNQINWNCELYGLAAGLTGDPELLRRDYRQHVESFCRYARRPQRREGSPNLGPGYHFVYLPQYSMGHPYNVDSAEYANETVHFILWHRQARAAGMAPLSRHARRILTAWVERILCGYWTHAGYLNWDSGFGLERMHHGKTWGLAHQALLAIALSPEFHQFKAYAGWAKHFHDAGLATFERLLDDEPDDEFPDASLHDLPERAQGSSARNLFAARMAAHAVRAVDWELTSVRSRRPPPLFAFDPDSGRLAVTTASYSTVVLPRNRRAVDYGGLEPARLLDARSQVAASLGGSTPASFGVRVRAAGGGSLLDTQSGRTEGPARPALEILRVRGGTRQRASMRSRAYPNRPYAGTFDRIETRGVLRGKDVEVATRHIFRDARFTLAWLIRGRGDRALRWEAAFPSSGDSATILAGLRDGATRPLERGARVGLADLSWVAVRSRDSGYVVVPRVRGDLEAWVVQPGPRATAPIPGPALMLGQARPRRLRSARFQVEIGLLGPDEDPAARARRLPGF